MLLKIRQLAEEAIALQNKNVMESALKDIAFMCAEAEMQKDISDVEMHAFEDVNSQELPVAPEVDRELKSEAQQQMEDSLTLASKPGGFLPRIKR